MLLVWCIYTLTLQLKYFFFHYYKHDLTSKIENKDSVVIRINIIDVITSNHFRNAEREPRVHAEGGICLPKNTMHMCIHSPGKILPILLNSI